jgi:hypothetical protein
MVELIDGQYETFDGENNNVITREEYCEINFNFMQKEIMLIEKNYTAKNKKLCIEDSYHTFIEMADELKRESNGLFNFYKTPTIKNMALNYFYDLTKSIQPDEINNNEAEFFIIFKQSLQWRSFKSGLTSVRKHVNLFKWLQVNHYFFLSLSIAHLNYTTEQDEPIWWHRFVKFQF